MRTLVTAFLFGAAAVGGFAFVGALAVGIVADAGAWGSFRLAVGPIVFLTFERSAAETSTVFGPGLGLVPFVAGAANAVSAYVLRRAGR